MSNSHPPALRPCRLRDEGKGPSAWLSRDNGAALLLGVMFAMPGNADAQAGIVHLELDGEGAALGELSVRVRSELRLLGYRVRTEGGAEIPTVRLIEEAGQVWVELTLPTASADPIRRREQGNSAALAVRVAEILHAHTQRLHGRPEEVGVTSEVPPPEEPADGPSTDPRSGDTPPDPPAVEEAGNQARADPMEDDARAEDEPPAEEEQEDARESLDPPPFWRAERSPGFAYGSASLAAVRASSDVGWGVAPALFVGVRLRPSLVLGASALLPGRSHRLALSEGVADVRLTFVTADVRLTLSQGRLQPFVNASAGALVLGARGQADAPLNGQRDRVSAVLVAAELGASLRLAPHVSLVAGARVGTTLRPLGVRIAAERSDRMAAPLVVLTLGLSVY